MHKALEKMIPVVDYNDSCNQKLEKTVNDNETTKVIEVNDIVNDYDDCIIQSFRNKITTEKTVNVIESTNTTI